MRGLSETLCVLLLKVFFFFLSFPLTQGKKGRSGDGVRGDVLGFLPGFPR